MSQMTDLHRLRVLIVDDNQINLSVLSTLLKRRFSGLLDGSPVAVDSGLKAIQLLRTHVFDLILMDIQMPFLSGLDATLRIRNGEDDVLAANADAHIVAVTTAVGDEPEAAYRRAGMDGMIGKPVRFQDMHHYISPLAREAQHAAQSVPVINVDGNMIMPPLPPVASRYQRLFYLPADATIRSPCPDICKGADFEKMLRSQTRASLRKSGAMAIGGSSSSLSPRSPSRTHAAHDAHLHGSTTSSINEEDTLTVNAAQTAENETHIDNHDRRTTDSKQASPSQDRRQHLRHSTMTINNFTFTEQIRREMNSLDGNDSDGADLSSVRTHGKRPAAVHRISSPAWLMSLDDKFEMGDSSLTPSSEEALSINPLRLRQPARPKWLSALRDRGSSRSQDATSTSQSTSLSSMTELDTDLRGPSTVSLSDLRRDSHQSTGSGFSEVSTELTTPSSEIGSWDVDGSAMNDDHQGEIAHGSIHDDKMSAKTDTRLKVKTSDSTLVDTMVESPINILPGRRSFSADEVSLLSHGVRRLDL